MFGSFFSFFIINSGTQTYRSFSPKLTLKSTIERFSNMHIVICNRRKTDPTYITYLQVGKGRKQITTTTIIPSKLFVLIAGSNLYFEMNEPNPKKYIPITFMFPLLILFCSKPHSVTSWWKQHADYFPSTKAEILLKTHESPL